MRNNKNFVEFSFSPQITADSEFGLIISNGITTETRDVNQLQPLVIQAEENIGGLPTGTKVSADYGYYTSKNLQFLESKGLDGYIPDLTNFRFKGKNVKEEDPFSKENFRYDSKNDQYICPRNHKLTFHLEYLDINVNKIVRRYKGTNCKQCPDFKNCTKNYREGRVIKNIGGMEMERIRMNTDFQMPLNRHNSIQLSQSFLAKFFYNRYLWTASTLKRRGIFMTIIFLKNL